MIGIWLDTPVLQVCRENQGVFEVCLKPQQLTLVATVKETHHFARVLVALKQLGISDCGRYLKSALEDFVVAILGRKNYYIRRMYFATQPEMIAQWYYQPASQ